MSGFMRGQWFFTTLMWGCVLAFVAITVGATATAPSDMFAAGALIVGGLVTAFVAALATYMTRANLDDMKRGW